MKRSVFNQIEKLNTLQASLESQINDFVGLNLKSILKEIIKDGKDGVEECEDGEYAIYLLGEHTVIMDGEAYTAYNLIYDTEDDTVYLEVSEISDYIEFADIEPTHQLEIIFNLTEKFFS